MEGEMADRIAAPSAPSDGLSQSTAAIERGDLLALSVMFALVEGSYHWAGLRFDASWLDWAWQYLDPVLLRRDLLRSLFYLHTQPPIFNLFLGVSLKLTGRHAPAAFHALYGFCGLALDVGLFVLMRRLGVSRLLAFVATTLFAMSPATVAMEHVLFYELPVATLVVWAAVAASGLADRPSYRRALVFCILLATLCLTRALFHVVYFIAAIAVVMVAAPAARSMVLRAAIVPLATVLALYFKNALVFGFFGASSWLGMSLARMTLPYADASTVQRLVGARRLSPIAAIEPFSPIGSYPIEYRALPAFATHPALSLERKSNGHINYNHAAFLTVSREYLADAFTIVRSEPSAYCAAVASSWTYYFLSGTDNTLAEGIVAPIRRWIWWWDSIIYLRWPGTRIYLILLLGLPIAGAYAVSRSRRNCAWAFVALTIGFVAVVGNAMEVGENNRFRFITDALSVAAFAGVVQASARLVRRLAIPSATRAERKMSD
jgi:hypothetical protein